MSEAARSWAIIPARGGSKGIPGKNLKKIQGRSLIARAIDAAIGAAQVERVFVSTDDAKIAATARHAGAEIIERPADLASDIAGSELALLHGLDTLERSGERLPELLAFVQCTSPFVHSVDIDAAIAVLRDTKADTALTVTPGHGFLWKRDSAGTAVEVNHDKRGRLRRQDREPEFLETGAVYVMRIGGFRAARHRFFGKTAMHEVPAIRAMEIDTPDDLAIARLLAPLVEPTILSSAIPRPLGGIVFDFDGVMTDDSVVQGETGDESVVCSRADGLGIEMLRNRSIPMAVISRERNPVVAKRCEKLSIACLAARDDKLAALRSLSAQWHVALDSLVYVGNDLPDLACMGVVGLGVAVADAHPQVRAAADLVLARRGGRGAVRELCDLVLSAEISKA